MSTCVVCGHTPARRAFSKDGLLYRRCPRCRFLFARPVINANLQSTLDEFDTAYLQYLGQDIGDSKDHATLMHFMQSFGFGAGQSVLDVGCGGGKFVRRLRRDGINAMGLEPSAALFGKFLSNDSRFVHGQVQDVSQRWANTFDVITAFDVLEHVQEPDTFLQHAARMLKPHGRLFLSTPDNASLMATLFGRSWHYYNRFHLSLFSPATVRRLAPRCGLHWVACRRLARWRSLAYLGRYFFEFGLKRAAPPWVQSLNNLHLPINFFDTMNLCLAKSPVK